MLTFRHRAMPVRNRSHGVQYIKVKGRSTTNSCLTAVMFIQLRLPCSADVLPVLTVLHLILLDLNPNSFRRSHSSAGISIAVECLHYKFSCEAFLCGSCKIPQAGYILDGNLQPTDARFFRTFFPDWWECQCGIYLLQSQLFSKFNIRIKFCFLPKKFSVNSLASFLSKRCL